MSETGITVNIGFFPLAFILILCTPKVEIDGVIHKAKWGTQYYDLKPGKHFIKIYFRYLFISHCGLNSVSFTIAEGEQKNLKFYMWPSIVMKGSMTLW